MGFTFIDILFVIVSAMSCLSIAIMACMIYSYGFNVTLSRNKASAPVVILALIPACLVFLAASGMMLFLLWLPLKTATDGYNAAVWRQAEVKRENPIANEMFYDRQIEWNDPTVLTPEEVTETSGWHDGMRTRTITLRLPPE